MACDLILYDISITGDCSNTNSGAFSFEIASSAPVSYQINFISPFVSALTITTTSYYLTGLSGGSYSFTVTDANCTVPEVIYISTGTCTSILDVQNTTCDLDNGALTASTTYLLNGGATYYLYETTNGYITSANSFSDYTFTNLSAGTYYVIADDGGGCTGKSESCIIKSSTTLNYGLYAVADGSCSANTNSGKIFITGLTGTPPYTYLWTPGGQTTQTATGLTGNTFYNVLVTDSSGCSKGNGIFVPEAQPLGLVAYTSISPTCFNSDGEVTIFISGGTAPYFYSGNNAATVVSFAQNYTFTGLSAGLFNVYVVDSGLCSYLSPSTSLTTPNTFSTVVVNVTNSTCNNQSGNISVYVTDGLGGAAYTFTLDDGTTTISNNTIGNSTQFNNLFSGTYTLSVNVQGDTSCVFTQTVVINNVDLFTISANTTGTTCNLSNGSVLISVGPGGTAPYLYEVQPLSPSPFSNITPSYPNDELLFNGILPSGNYLASVTDSIGCTQTVPFTINSSPNVSFILVATNTVVGNDGTISVFITSGTPPFTLNWSSNVNGQTGTTVTGLSGGTYFLNVTDSNGCTFKNDVVVYGTTLISSYQTYNICENTFENEGIVIQKGIKQMLVEGYYDLTKNDTNCILNSSVFTIEVEIGGNLKQSTFFTGTTLNEYPTDDEWYSQLTDILYSFDGIGDVKIDQENNQVSITTSCGKNNSYLNDASIKVNLLINYDISCVACIS